MITPSFFGINNATRGILAAQTALSVIGHNIANVNTPGYSRQRVELGTEVPYSQPGLSSIGHLSQLGQGVVITGITRAREAGLDDQFRNLNMQQGSDSSIYEGLRSIQTILAETETTGLSKNIQAFFNSVHELSVHPDNLAVRNNFIIAAQQMVNEFKTKANQLQTLQTQLVGNTPGSELTQTVNDVNEKLRQLAEINNQIGTVTSVGGQPNDLKDQRDKLLDELAGLTDFTTTQLPGDQISLSIAGQVMVNRGILQNTLTLANNPGPAPNPDFVPTLVQTTTGSVVLNDGAGAELTKGKLYGILQVAGQSTGNSTNVRGMLENLNGLMVAIANEVNNIQSTGRDMNGALGAANLIFTPAAPATPPLEIFQYNVNATVANNVRLIAAAANDASAPANFAGQGDGRNALLMAQLKDKVITAFPATPLNMTFEDYLENRVSNMASNTSLYENRTKTGDEIMVQVDTRRLEASGVNMDQELSDMIRFQRGFEASAKMLKTYDETIQMILSIV